MKIYFLISVDCDLRTSSVVIRDRSLISLLDLFERFDLAGHVTWFINENDFALTHNHADFLNEIASRGDTIGLHDHIDYLYDDLRYDLIRDFCLRSLDSVRQFFNRDTIVAHRFGCLFQRPVCYRVLADLGYTICSDVCPGGRHNNHSRRLSFDNRTIPVGTGPYRHDIDSIEDYESDTGHFIQFPMMKATLTADFWAHLDRSIIDSWIEGAEKYGNGECVMTFGFHPYEIVDELRIDQQSLKLLEDIIVMMRDEYNAQFISMEEYGVGIRTSDPQS